MIDMPPVQPTMEMSPVTVECIEHSTSVFQVHKDILYAVLMVEGGSVGNYGDRENSDGTKDVGPAQINEIHMEELNDFGITKEELKNNGCLNIYVAARYLSIVLSQVKSIASVNDYLYAIARYNTKDKEKAKPYVEKLKRAFAVMYNLPIDGGK